MKKNIFGIVVLGIFSSGLFANSLSSAKLETGLKVVGDGQQEVIATFIKDNLSCVTKGLAKIDNASKKAFIHFDSAKCGNEYFKMSGVFFDKDKMLGATLLDEKNKYIILPLQDGFIDTIEWYSQTEKLSFKNLGVVNDTENNKNLQR